MAYAANSRRATPSALGTTGGPTTFYNCMRQFETPRFAALIGRAVTAQGKALGLGIGFDRIALEGRALNGEIERALSGLSNYCGMSSQGYALGYLELPFRAMDVALAKRARLAVDDKTVFSVSRVPPW